MEIAVLMVGMNGHNHALTAVAAYATSLAVGHTTFGLDLPSTTTAAYGAAVALGVGLAPDIDEKHSIASQGAGLFGAATRSITSLFGGHRSITHSPIPMGLALTALAHGLVVGDVAAKWLGVVAAITVALGVPFLVGPRRRSKLGFGLDLFVVAVAVAVYVASPLLGVTAGWWLFAALPVAFLSHVLGDSITPAGIPWFWPLSKSKVGLPLLTSGGFAEDHIVTPLLTIAVGYSTFRVLTLM